MSRGQIGLRLAKELKILGRKMNWVGLGDEKAGCDCNYEDD